MEVREHWWNGTWGSFVRRDLWLQVDGEQWSLRVRWSTYPEQTFLYASEADARHQLELLLSPEEGPWKRVS